MIGVELPRDTVVAGVRAACARARRRTRTTSRGDPDERRGPEARLPRGGAADAGAVRLAAQAKGAGMISPRYATMFCFVQTDAALDADTLDLLTGVCVKRSFDRISRRRPALHQRHRRSRWRTARPGVRVEPRVAGRARPRRGARRAAAPARARDRRRRRGRPARRPRGRDAAGPTRSSRWRARSPTRRSSRPRCTAATPTSAASSRPPARSWPPGEPFVVDLEIEGHQVVSAGDAIGSTPATSAELVQGDEVEYALTLPGEGGETEVFFCDLAPSTSTSTRSTRHERRRNAPRGAPVHPGVPRQDGRDQVRRRRDDRARAARGVRARRRAPQVRRA